MKKKKIQTPTIDLLQHLPERRNEKHFTSQMNGGLMLHVLTHVFSR